MARTPRQRILWVDDQVRGFERFAEELRKKHNLTVDTTPSIEEAEKLGISHKYQLFVIDLRIPSGDAIDLIRRLHDLQPECPLVALSSYLYDQSRRDSVAQLGFHVELIDKNLSSVHLPEFERNFVNPILRALNRKVEHDQPSRRRKRRVVEDPFAISYTDYMERPQTEKDALTQTVENLAKETIQREFNNGAIWIMLCGSKDKPLVTANDPAKFFSQSEILEQARNKGKAFYQFVKPPRIEEISFSATTWSDCGSNTRLSNYPTITVLLPNQSRLSSGYQDTELTLHFDTGSEVSFLSFETAIDVGFLNPEGPPVDIPIEGHERKKIKGITFREEVSIQSQLDGQKVNIQLSGYAIYEWVNFPYARFCTEQCPTERRLQDGFRNNEGYSICPFRRGLLGRPILSDERLVLVLDGRTRKTGVRGVTPDSTQRKSRNEYSG